jgi:CheY-like chemotaxis protein
MATPPRAHRLREEGLDLVLARGGADALLKLADFPADVIVADVERRRIDGEALYKAVAELPIATPRFIFVSDVARPEHDGQRHWLARPLDAAQLARFIGQAVHHPRRGDLS